MTKEEMAQVIEYVCPLDVGEGKVFNLPDRQRKALRKGEHDRPLMRYEDDEGEEIEGGEDEEQEMEMSPERDIPLNVAFEEPVPQVQGLSAATEPATNGAASSTISPPMPLALGGKFPSCSSS